MPCTAAGGPSSVLRGATSLAAAASSRDLPDAGGRAWKSAAMAGGAEANLTGASLGLPTFVLRQMPLQVLARRRAVCGWVWANHQDWQIHLLHFRMLAPHQQLLRSRFSLYFLEGT